MTNDAFWRNEPEDLRFGETNPRCRKISKADAAQPLLAGQTVGVFDEKLLDLVRTVASPFSTSWPSAPVTRIGSVLMTLE